MTAAPPRKKYTAALTCPSCGCGVTGRWLGNPETAAQQCGACGHVFDAAWPGFTFEPETVVIHPERGDEAG